MESEVWKRPAMEAEAAVIPTICACMVPSGRLGRIAEVLEALVRWHPTSRCSAGAGPHADMWDRSVCPRQRPEGRLCSGAAGAHGDCRLLTAEIVTT